MDYMADSKQAAPRFVFYQPIETVVPPPPKPLEVAFYAPVETIGYRPAPITKEIRYTTFPPQRDALITPLPLQPHSNRTREENRYVPSPTRTEPGWSPPTHPQEDLRLSALTRVDTNQSSRSLPIRPREEGRYAESSGRAEPVTSSSRSLRSPSNRPREEHAPSPRLDPTMTQRFPQPPTNRSRQEGRYTLSPIRQEAMTYSQGQHVARSHEEQRYSTHPVQSETYSRSSPVSRRSEERYATPPLRAEPTPSPRLSQPQRSPPLPVSPIQEHGQSLASSSESKKDDWGDEEVLPQPPILTAKKTIDWGDGDSVDNGSKKGGFLGFGGDSSEVKETQGWWKKIAKSEERAKAKAEAKAAQAARNAAAMPKPLAYKTTASAAERVVVFF